MKKLPREKGNIGKVRIINMKIGLKVKFSNKYFRRWFLIFLKKGTFFENLKFVFLSNMICKTPKKVKIGAKKMT